MMLADAEAVEADLLGEDGFVDDVAQHLRLRLRRARRIERDVAERVEAEFKRVRSAHTSTLSQQT